MPCFPFFIDIKHKPCLVVGGGEVAYRKVVKLMPFQPEIKVVAPEICEEIRSLEGVHTSLRRFCESDLEGVFFVISATDDQQLNSRIFALCSEKKILVNTVDDKDKCGFIFPALATCGDISVGISTGGKSPLLASLLREKAQQMLSERYLEAAELLGDCRKTVKREFHEESQRKRVFEVLLSHCLEDEEIPSAKQLNCLIKEMKYSYETKNRNT